MGLLDMMEDLKNRAGVAKWQQGRDLDRATGYNAELADRLEPLFSLAEGSAPLGGLAGMVKRIPGGGYKYPVQGVRPTASRYADLAKDDDFSWIDDLKKKPYSSWSRNSDEEWDDELDELVSGPEYVLIDSVETPRTMRNQGYGDRELRRAIYEAQTEAPGLPIRLAAYPKSDVSLDDLVRFYEKRGFDADADQDSPAVTMTYFGGKMKKPPTVTIIPQPGILDIGTARKAAGLLGD